MRAVFTMLSVLLLAAAASAESPAAPADFDPAPGASGIWISETQFRDGPVKSAWKVTDVVAEKKVAIYADDRAGAGGPGAYGDFRNCCHLDWRAWKDGEVEILAARPFQNQKLDLRLRWTRWDRMEGTFILREWKQGEGGFEWVETAKYRTAWKRRMPEIWEVRQEKTADGTSRREVELTISGENLVRSASGVFYTNGAGDFPYVLAAPRADLRVRDVSWNDRGTTMSARVDFPADLAPGCYEGYVGGRLVPALLTVWPTDGKPRLLFEDLRGRPIRDAAIGDSVRIRMIAAEWPDGSSRPVRVASRRSDGEVLTEPVETGVRLEWAFPPLRMDGTGRWVSDVLRIGKHLADSSRGPSGGLVLRAVVGGSLAATLHRPGSSWDTAAATANLQVRERKPAILDVRVVHENSGEPLAGARVIVTDPAGGAVLAEGSPDADGRVRLQLLPAPEAACRVTGRSPGKGTAGIDVACVEGASKDVVLRIPDTPGRLEGVVVNAATGAPIAGADVRLSTDLPETSRSALETKTTGGDGTFVFEGVQGIWELHVDARGAFPLSENVRVAAGSSISLRLALSPDPLGLAGVLGMETRHRAPPLIAVPGAGLVLRSVLEHPELSRSFPDAVDPSGRLRLEPALEPAESADADLPALEKTLSEALDRRKGMRDAWLAAGKTPEIPVGDDPARREAIRRLEALAAERQEHARESLRLWKEAVAARLKAEKDGEDTAAMQRGQTEDFMAQEFDWAMAQHAQAARQLLWLRRGGPVTPIDRVEEEDLRSLRDLIEKVRSRKPGGK